MSFSVESLTALDQLKPNARIHVIGVCGVAMAQIAIELSKRGFDVSGSDKEFFEPMSSLLKTHSLKTFNGYNPDNIQAEIDLVLIGNSVTSSNPEVLKTDQLGLAYSIFPQILNELAIGNRHSIVVSGTHGKTTTTAMLAYLLVNTGKDPSYFVGGKSSQLKSGLNVGQGKFCVTEGDEYDSAFFAKFAKFHFYKPDTLIVTSIEFDHADIYSNLEEIQQQFYKLASNLPKDSNIIAYNDDEGVRSFVSRVKDLPINLITYGETDDSNVKITFESGQVLFNSPKKKSIKIALQIPGRYNLKNAVASALALEAAGLEINAELIEKFKEFTGVDRRQQVWLKDPLMLIEDFAHHPSAVRETLAGIREWFPTRRLIAVFEPRSNTSRKKIFQSDYVRAFKDADLIILKEVESRSLDSASDLFDVKVVVQEINSEQQQALSLESVEKIKEFILANAKKDDVIIVMSNGSFGGLTKLLADQLKSKKLS